MSLVMIKLCFNYAVKFFFVMIMTFSSSPVMFPELNMWYLKLFKAIRVLSSSSSSYSRHFPFSVFNFFSDFFSLHGLNPNPHHYYHHLSSSLLISKWYLVPTYIYHHSNHHRGDNKGHKADFYKKEGPTWPIILLASEKRENRKVHNSNFGFVWEIWVLRMKWESYLIQWN